MYNSYSTHETYYDCECFVHHDLFLGFKEDFSITHIIEIH